MKSLREVLIEYVESDSKYVEPELQRKVTRGDQKEWLLDALINLKMACAVSKTGSEFALDGEADRALESLQLVVDRH